MRTQLLRRTRIVLAQGGHVWPICAINEASGRDGGLILDLSGCTPITRWKYGPMDVPSGAMSAVLVPREREVVEVQGKPPKLHYHRSGFVSIDQTDNLPKRYIQSERLDELHDDHCFGLVIRHPFRFRLANQRETDSVIAVHGAAPTSVKIVGRIGQIDDLQPEHQAFDTNPRQLSIEENGSIVPTVLAVLPEHGCYTRIGLHPNPPEFDARPEPAAVVLFAFSPRGAANPSDTGEVLGVFGEESLGEIDSSGGEI